MFPFYDGNEISFVFFNLEHEEGSRWMKSKCLVVP